MFGNSLKTVTANSGYCSEKNLLHLKEAMQQETQALKSLNSTGSSPFRVSGVKNGI